MWELSQMRLCVCVLLQLAVRMRRFACVYERECAFTTLQHEEIPSYTEWQFGQRLLWFCYGNCVLTPWKEVRCESVGWITRGKLLSRLTPLARNALPVETQTDFAMKKRKSSSGLIPELYHKISIEKVVFFPPLARNALPVVTQTYLAIEKRKRSSGLVS